MIEYKEYRDEIPYNTLITWSRALMRNARWKPIGWTGNAAEPYRHWASYPELEGVTNSLWEFINHSIQEDGVTIKPDRVILNLYNHGDSSWLHRDSEDPNDWTVIVFMNEHWNINWGGDFALARDNELLASFAPTPGKFVLFKSNILHGARPVSREAPYPRFGVAFQCKYDQNVQGLSHLKIPSVRTTL
jgi:hypothetical protein